MVFLSSVPELNVDILTMFRSYLPESTPGEVKNARNDDIGELLKADIVDVDRFVEKLTAIGYLVFEFGNPVAKLRARFASKRSHIDATRQQCTRSSQNRLYQT